MYLERLDIEGFRNCCQSVKFDSALTLILGENNAGKTNLVDALRLALTAETGSDRLRPRLSDFARGADGKRTSEEFAITAVLARLSVREQGQLSLALAPKTEGYGKARIGLRARISGDEEVTWYRCGGDFDSPDVEQRALNAVHHTYLPPLRDAGSDLQPGRTNRLARLLHVLAPEQVDRDSLVKVAQEANEELAKHPKVRRAVELIQGVLNEMTLEGHRQESDIAFRGRRVRGTRAPAPRAPRRDTGAGARGEWSRLSEPAVHGGAPGSSRGG
jgi:putative ATP-dependent endonuclease of OLD family